MRRSGVCIVALALVGALVLPPATVGQKDRSIYEPPIPFCEGQSVGSFMKQLEGLPALREPNFDRLGPWAPRSVYLGDAERIQTGPAPSVGWTLRYGSLPRRLDWLVTAKMTRIRPDGSPVGEIATRRIRVGRPGKEASGDFTFDVPADLAIYRVEVAFRNSGGRLLGRFGRYFRVMRPRREARLGLNGTAYRPGEDLRARVENIGTKWISYGPEYWVERLEGLSWINAPEGVPELWARVLHVMLPGGSGLCNIFHLPPEMAPGRYRLVKPMENPKITLTAEFDVVP